MVTRGLMYLANARLLLMVPGRRLAGVTQRRLSLSLVTSARKMGAGRETARTARRHILSKQLAIAAG